MVLDAVGASESGAQMSAEGPRRSAAHVHPAVRHRGGLRRPRPGARTRRGAGLAGPSRPDPAGISGRRSQDGADLPDDRLGAVVGARRSGRARRRPHRVAGPRLGHHQLRRREDLRRGGRTRDRRPSGVYDVVVVGRPSERWGSEVVAVVQLAEDSSSPTRNSSRWPAHIARYKVPKAFVRRRRLCGPPPARPITAGRRLRHWTRRESAGHLLTVASPRSRDRGSKSGPPVDCQPHFACRIGIQITMAA